LHSARTQTFLCSAADCAVRGWLSFPLSPRAGNEYQAEVTNRKGLLAWYERIGQSKGVAAAAASIGSTTETATKVQ
jgi:hypothetical protein